MAVSVATAKAAAAAQGAKAPEDYPGGPDQWAQDWYQNAVNAGSIQGERTKGELTATDETTGETPQGYKNTGTSAFADMIRKKAKDEGWSEDFERFSDAQIDAWQKYYDPSVGRFKSEHGGEGYFEKPSECPEGTTLHGSKCVSWDALPWELGGNLGAGGGGSAGQGGGGGSPYTQAPSTFGSQLSYTGNPLTDMLLYQFNTGAQLSDPSKMNTFAMGEDRQEGGTGAAADQGKRTGQLLQGGGLWWQGEQQEKGADAFGGFRADTANSNAANPLSMANKPAAAAEAAPTPQAIASPPPSQPSFAQTPATGMSGMLGNSFKPKESWRNKAAGGAAKNPLEVQAF